MRERASRTEYDQEQYHVSELLHPSTSKKRLDLNDLLKRAKDQEKSDKKFNVLIYTSAASVLAVLLLIFSI